MKTRAHSSILTRPIAPNSNFNHVPWRRGFLLIALALTVAFASSPSVEATCRQGCDATNTFLGEDALVNTTFGGYPNTAVGYHALFSDTTGYGNSAIGNEALLSNTVGIFNAANGSGVLYSNTSGFYNTANGAGALYLNSTASNNTATGFEALHGNTTGSNNTANGIFALYANTTGDFNTATGNSALWGNTTGSFNTATGGFALVYNTTGNNNSASGYSALYGNTTGGFNTASGYSALYTNTTGGFNVASGGLALFSNTTGNSNTATGYDALYSNQNGMNNTATGVETLVRNTTGSSNTALGYFALINNTTGNNNIAVGEHAGSALTTGSDNIAMGNPGVAAESSTIRIGTQGTQTSTYVAGIWQRPVTGTASPVRVNSSGKLGTVPSSARFKAAIQSMDKSSEAIHSLRPVTFRYKEELDPEGIPQFGLVAEEVAKVNPDLVVRDEEGKPYTVRYEAVSAMLLNEFLKEHRKVEQLRKDFESKLAEQQMQIEAVTAGLRKVSAQVETSKAAQNVARNNP